MLEPRLFACFSLVVLFVPPVHAQTVDYYRFEDGSPGAAATVLTNLVTKHRDGSLLAGAPTYGGTVPVDPIPQTGTANMLSLSLGGTDAFQFGYAFPFQTLRSATLELWINPTTLQSENDFIWGNNAPGSGDCNRFLFGVAGGVPFVNYRDAGCSAHIVSGAPVIVPAGEWSYLAFVKAENTYSIYVENSMTHYKIKLESLVTDNTPSLPTATGWTINGRNTIDNYNSCVPYYLCQFAGLIDEVRMSSKALTPAQFLAHPP